jgi:hypothetical protein
MCFSERRCVSRFRRTKLAEGLQFVVDDAIFSHADILFMLRAFEQA